MAIQRHLVVIPQGDGVALYPLKRWLREHPSELPTGVDSDQDTSHTLRRALVRAGWTMQETPTEVRLIKPGCAPAAMDVLEGEESDTADGSDGSFALEAHLRDFLVENITNISVNDHQLQLYVDANQRKGVEYQTGVGRIDVLAVDDAGAFYVFELKLANSPDYALGQVARYMGWLRENMGKGKAVFGVIVARSIDEKLRYAVSVVPNIFLFEYQVQFRLRPAHKLATKN